MRFKHTNRPGFWFGFIDFCTAGLFFLFYMPLGGLQDELDDILGQRTQRYWVAYLLGIPTLFIYTLVWMANIAVLVAYVRLEYLRSFFDGAGSCNLAVLRHIE